jgi:hypothetical protein
MKHGPSLEPTNRAIRKQVPLTLWNRKGHYNLQNIAPHKTIPDHCLSAPTLCKARIIPVSRVAQSL